MFSEKIQRRNKAIEKEHTKSSEHYSADQIAKWFLAYNRNMMIEKDSEYISNYKLQNLLYYAQGVFCAMLGRTLFCEPIVAWEQGPVVESVWTQYKSNGLSGFVG